jgi:hypothetical protein
MKESWILAVSKDLCVLDIDNLQTRQLQVEAARALAAIEATSDNIWQFNQAAHHDSQNWYRAVIKWYVNEYGDLPSRVGPGVRVKIKLDYV